MSTWRVSFQNDQITATLGGQPFGGESTLDRLFGNLKSEPNYPGDAPVYVALETSLGERTLALGSEYRVKPDADFFGEVRALLGEAAIS